MCVCVLSCTCMLQSCPTLCDPMDCSPPGSSVRGNFQTRILEWVPIFFSGRSSQPRDQTQVSCACDQFLSGAQLFVTSWSVVTQAPLSMGFIRQEWVAVPTPGDLPDPGIKPVSFASHALAGGFFTTEPPEKPWLSLLASPQSLQL